MTASIANVFAATKSGFNALQSGATNVQALSGDRIVMMTAQGEASDVLQVVMVKKKVLNTVSEVTGEKMSIAVMTFDDGGVELTDGSKAVLFKSLTGPIPSRKGSKKVLGAPTKLSICGNIFLQNPEAEKSTVCKRFQAEANCTRQGANTYYLLLAKKFAAGELVKAVNGDAPAEVSTEAAEVTAAPSTEVPADAAPAAVDNSAPEQADAPAA